VKLLLQRTLNPHWDGPFRVEEARWEGHRLSGFLSLRKGSQSDFEPRYDGQGRICYLSDWPEPVSLYRSPHELIERGPVFKAAFDALGQRATLVSHDEGPWGLSLDGREPEFFPSSLTHVVAIAHQGWCVSSLDRLYEGRPGQWQDRGPIEYRRFTCGTEGQLFYCLNRQLFGHTPGRVLWHEVDEGFLSFPLWTPRGLLVSQDDPQRLWWVTSPGQAEILWQGGDERLYVCDWASLSS